jgi:integrase
MATDKGRKLGLRIIEALEPNSEVFDGGRGGVAGFGARRRSGNSVSYFVMFRASGRLRRMTIGVHGSPWTPDSARGRALQILSEVRVDGADPAAAKQAERKALTMRELAEQYWHECESGRVLVRDGRPKKASTLRSDRGRIFGHIIPLLGNLRVTAVTKQDVERAMHRIAGGETAKTVKTKRRGVSKIVGGRGVATRTVGLLGAILSYAVDQGFRSDNPAYRIRKYAEGRRTRRLTDAEYRMLGDGLRQAAGTTWPPAVASLQFLALTGWRAGEALNLTWADVDIGRRTAVLPDSKSGRSTRPLSEAACEALTSIPRTGSGLVFPAATGGPMGGFRKHSTRIIANAGLPPDVTPHVLRHSFASLAGDLGLSEPTIGTLIGHKGQSTTSRYMHAADAVLLAAADRVASATAGLMNGDDSEGDSCGTETANHLVSAAPTADSD